VEKIEVNGFEIDWQRAEAKQQNLVRSIEAKQLALLKALYQANGAIVSQQQLLDEVWNNSVITPNTLQQTIAQLRKTLGDDGRAQVAIKTHPKLGYSLIFNIFEDQPSQDETNLTDNTKYLAFALVVLTLLIIYVPAWQPESEVKVEFSDFSPITVQNEIVQSASINKQNQTLFYVTSTEYGDTLIKGDLTNSSTSQIKQNLALHGAISLSPNGQYLAYGKQQKINDTKCINLHLLHLKTVKEETILPCATSFSHSAQWLNDNELLYFSTDKKHNNRLNLVNIKTKKTRPLLTHYNHIKSFAANNKTIAILLGEKVEIYSLDKTNRLSTAQHNFHFKPDEKYHQLRWLSDSEVALIGSAIRIADIDTELTTKVDMNVLSSQRILDLLPIKNNKVIAIMGQQNWDVRERLLNNNQDTVIGQSAFYERAGKYQAISANHSFLSNRTNEFQVWLNDNDALVQLTQAETDVTDFIWLSDSETLIYISNKQLWQQEKNSAAVVLATDFEPIRLYQSDDNHLLLSANNNDSQSLIWLNLATNEAGVLLNKEVQWAQRVNQKLFITNNEYGRLIKYENSIPNHIQQFKDTIIQWRYFWRQDNNQKHALYFQDKQQNIWRYDPVDDTTKVVGHFDENALFMTDFSALKNTMLSDNFVAEKRDLVELTMTHH